MLLKIVALLNLLSGSVESEVNLVALGSVVADVEMHPVPAGKTRLRVAIEAIDANADVIFFKNDFFRSLALKALHAAESLHSI